MHYVGGDIHIFVKFLNFFVYIKLTKAFDINLVFSFK